MKTILALFTKYKLILLVAAFALIGSLDLLNFGIPPTHDGEYHVMRFWQFYKVLSSGILYPRWAPDFNNGFGIPLFNYVYPLPNYVASLYHFLGFGFIDSLKLNMATASIMGAVFFYLWARKFWGDIGGVVSSIFYTFSPYHFLDIYVRGSAGEVWSLALAPGLLWAYTSFIETKDKKYLVFSAALLAFLIYSHNILALVFFGFFILYFVFYVFKSKNKKDLLVSTIIICLTGLGFAAPFWLPAIVETKYVQGLQIFNPVDYFPKLYQLVYSSWGYGFAGVNPKPGEGQMSFQVGIPNLIALVLVIFSLFFVKRLKHKDIIIYMSVLLFGFLFLVTPFSSFLWKWVPFVSFIQFPWRLLSVVILIISFIVGAITQDGLFKKNKYQIIIASLLICTTVFYSMRYAKAPFYHQRSDSHYLTRSNFTDGTNSPGDLFNTKWLNGVPDKSKSKINIQNGMGNPVISIADPNRLVFAANLDKPSKVVVNIAYFPGWTALVNNKIVRVENYHGIIRLGLKKGENNVVVYLKNTPIQNFAYIYFLLSILAIIYFKPYANRR